MVVFSLGACVAAAIFAVLAWACRLRASAIAAAVWAGYGAYEFAIYKRLLYNCTVECNIRIDLLVIWPLLIIVTVVALWQLARRALKGSA